MGKRREERIEQLSVGVDLHKNQFTVCAMYEEGPVVMEDEYRTTRDGMGNLWTGCTLSRRRKDAR